MNTVKKLGGLKRFFALCCRTKRVPKSQLLASPEALRAFGTVGNEHEADIMMMMAVIEYEFGRDNHYDDGQISAVKDALARVMTFMKECGTELAQYESVRQNLDKK